MVDSLDKSSSEVERQFLKETIRTLTRANNAENETERLETFQKHYEKIATFSTSTYHNEFLQILKLLIEKKLNSGQNHETTVVPLVVLSCVRILLRDQNHWSIFTERNGLNLLKKQIDGCVKIFSVDESMIDHQTASKIIREILRIIQRLFLQLNDSYIIENVQSSEIIRSLLKILGFHLDLSLLRDTLKILLQIIQTQFGESFLNDFFRVEVIESLFDLIENRDLTTIQLSLSILANVLSHKDARDTISHLNDEALSIFTGFLTHNNVKIIEDAIWCLLSYSTSDENRKQIRTIGGIPLLLSLLENRQTFDFTLPSTGKMNASVDHLFDMKAACCHCLSELSLNYTNGQKIIEANGIYTIAQLLFPEREEFRRRSSFLRLQRNTFRTLRYLFSLNKNSDQQQFKRLFPIEIFSLFLSIGNFKTDPNVYKEISEAWNKIPFDELEKIKNNRLISFNPKQEPTRYIQSYAVYECLGSGGFGSVYRVAKQGSTQMYALKEIEKNVLNHREDQSFGRIINEVNIIREQLRHPNVVNYYQIFVENEKLYIRMELIMGLSLQAHLNLFKEMEKKMSEEQIWKILIQLILALRYLHEEKGIVHRDLSSNNIMVDDDYHVKITDFGLAKLKTPDQSHMTSAVGTMHFSCPEIIQHAPYNKKADIWSLGCVIYHMAALVPPFFTSNILLLASQICGSVFDRTPLHVFSEKIQIIVERCLTIDPSMRPDIFGLANLCTEKLMIFTDTICASMKYFEKSLKQRTNPTISGNSNKIQNDFQRNVSTPGNFPSSTSQSNDNDQNRISIAPISIPQNRLRPKDPVRQLLEIVHKLVFISYIPKDTIQHQTLRLISRYRRFIFTTIGPSELKIELLKLSTNSKESIPISSGIDNSFQSDTKNVDFVLCETNQSTTYEQMMTFIDRILKMTDYFQQFPSLNDDKMKK